MRMMRLATPVRLLAGATILIALAIAIATARFLVQDPTGHYPKARVVYWQLGVENTTNEPLKDVQIRSFAPVRLSWQQRLLSLESNVPLVGATETHREGEVRANVALIPPFGRRDIRFQATMAMADDHQNAHLQNAHESLYRERPAAERDTGIAELAWQFEGATEMETTRSIYDWLVSEIQYTGYDPIDRGAITAFEQRAGDCSEYAALAVALARELEIEARKVNGFVVQENGRLGPFDFHSWAEVRVEDRWVILDAQERQFDPAPSAYLATGYGPERRDSGGVKFAANSDAVRVHML